MGWVDDSQKFEDKGSIPLVGREKYRVAQKNMDIFACKNSRAICSLPCDFLVRKWLSSARKWIFS
jgi:hypothetical protein